MQGWREHEVRFAGSWSFDLWGLIEAAEAGTGLRSTIVPDELGQEAQAELAPARCHSGEPQRSVTTSNYGHRFTFSLRNSRL